MRLVVKKHFLIVGAGFAGCTLARNLAEAGFNVSIIDKRSHIAGNAFDEVDEHGILVHRYGPHIFHTNAKSVFDFLSRFTKWRDYEHKVLAYLDGQHYPIPINQDTVNKLYGLDLNEAGVKQFFEENRIPFENPKNSEEVVLNSVGEDLYQKFFYGYTKKQWGLEPSQLSAGVTSRIPVRCNQDDRYFTDQYQAMPLNGYSKMFEAMLDHPLISIKLNCDYLQKKDEFDPDFLIYTGPIDAYFKHCYGRLPYRSLQFEHQHIADNEQLQKVGTVNYPNEFDYTRITEFKHLTGQVTDNGTSIVKEYACDEGDPYYPIPRPSNEALYQQYKALAEKEENVYFVGRLAQYRYYNMDQVVAAALKLANNLTDSISA